MKLVSEKNGEIFVFSNNQS